MSWMCDLHMHSNASDGLLSAEALVDAMAAGGVRLMALTDHDDVSAVLRAKQHAARLGIEVWAGVEITVAEADGAREMHVLGLGIDAQDYLARIPPALVSELHLAGHKVEQHVTGTLLIDDHGSPVSDETWDLYTLALRRFGICPTLIEWDNDVPEWAALHTEALKAERILAAGGASRAA